MGSELGPELGISGLQLGFELGVMPKMRPKGASMD